MGLLIEEYDDTCQPSRDATSMDKSFRVMIIERGIARRGTPSGIWSDHATVSIASAKELISCIENLNCHALILLVQEGLTHLVLLYIMKVHGKGFSGA